MKTTTKAQVFNQLELAEKHAFKFVQKEQKSNKLREKIKTLESKTKDKGVKGLIVGMLGLFVICGLVLMEMNIGELSIATFFNSDGQGADNSVMASFGGGCFAIAILILGLQFHRCRKVITHPVTGRTTRSTNYGQIGGAILGVLIIIGIQYYLHINTGTEASKSISILAILLPLAELLFGFYFLDRIINALSLRSLMLSLKSKKPGCDREARYSNREYRDYNLLRNSWNTNNPNDVLDEQFNPNIRRAIAYYNGVDIDGIDN